MFGLPFLKFNNSKKPKKNIAGLHGEQGSLHDGTAMSSAFFLNCGPLEAGSWLWHNIETAHGMMDDSWSCMSVMKI